VENRLRVQNSLSRRQLAAFCSLFRKSCRSSQSDGPARGAWLKCTHRNPPRKETKVNILKHMEAAFIVALAVAGTSAAVVEARDIPAPAAIQDSSIATPGKMAVVTVKAKRLSPAQKLELALEERRAGKHA
jgi:hypothetical protein